MYAERNNFGVFALLLLLNFKFVNVNFLSKTAEAQENKI